MQGSSRRVLPLLVAVVTLSLGALRAEAHRSSDHCTREDAQNAAPGIDAADVPVRVTASTDAAIEVEASHPLPSVVVYGAARASGARSGWWTGRVSDRFNVRERLRSLKRLRLVRLFDDARITIFVGVNRSGVAGVHIQEQDPVAIGWIHHEAQADPVSWRANLLP